MTSFEHEIMKRLREHRKAAVDALETTGTLQDFPSVTAVQGQIHGIDIAIFEINEIFTQLKMEAG